MTHLIGKQKIMKHLIYVNLFIVFNQLMTFIKLSFRKILSDFIVTKYV